MQQRPLVSQPRRLTLASYQQQKIYTRWNKKKTKKRLIFNSSETRISRRAITLYFIIDFFYYFLWSYQPTQYLKDLINNPSTKSTAEEVPFVAAWERKGEAKWIFYLNIFHSRPDTGPSLRSQVSLVNGRDAGGGTMTRPSFSLSSFLFRISLISPSHFSSAFVTFWWFTERGSLKNANG